MMMKPDFDPYDLLIECLERLQMLEQKHANLATAFRQTDREFNLALKSLQHLQQTHLVNLSNQAKLEKRIKELESLNNG